MDLYHHQPLRREHSIRLLRLKSYLPSRLPEPQVELFEVSLDNKPTYEALSYAWEAHVAEDYVMCEGMRIPVTQNCVAALRRLRPSWKDRVLWVDAICIDQNNETERSHQVSLMGRIFSQARRVVVWLGEEDENSKICIRGTWKTLVMNMGDMPLLHHGVPVRLHTRSMIIVQDAYEKMLGRSWFHRTWVIQEVALATNLDVVCGSDTVSWEHLEARIFAYCDGHSRWHTSLSRGVDHVRGLGWFVSAPIFRARNTFKAGKLDAFAALVLARRSSATIAHDRIFGLLGVCEELAQAVGYPSYLEPLEDVYTKAAKALLHSGGLPMFWAMLGCGMRPGWPSWVPDFSTNVTPWSLSSYAKARACRRSKVQSRVLPEKRQLLLKGKIVDVIEMRSDATISRSDGLDAKVRACHKWFAMVQKGARYGPNVDLLRLMWETIWPNYSLQRSLENIPTCDDAWLNAALRYLDVGTDLEIGASVKFVERRTDDMMDKTAFITFEGRFGLANGIAIPGDRLAIFAGSRWPLVLRPSNAHEYRLVSGCFVPGIMEGEAFPNDETELDWITLG